MQPRSSVAPPPPLLLLLSVMTVASGWALSLRSEEAETGGEGSR